MTAALTDPIFTNETSAIAHMEASRWGADLSALFCPLCGSDKPKKMGGKTQAGMFLCGDCRGKFTVRTGTIFERSHIPLHKWLLATHLMAASKKGISAHQLHRLLGITYKSAWFMAHRIREAMSPSKKAKPMGSGGKVVEVDETYYGRKKGHTAPKGGAGHKHAVVSLVERGGEVRSIYTPMLRQMDMRKILKDNLSPEAHLRTDESTLYGTLRHTFASHEKVNHGKDEYVRGDAYTNTAEGVFSIFKRGMIGTYQHCGEQHLQRYLHEFDFRYSNREAVGVNDMGRAARILKGAEGKRLMYRQRTH
ncbi:MAG: IS1595 family transposase [Proteobacteria bacterium]|nr:IS1595 family transposase [Pseudomonadota bacterium]